MKKNKMWFFTLIYEPNTENMLIKKSNVGLDIAANVFQWNVIEGINYLNDGKLEILNCLPIGTWPTQFKQFLFKEKSWQYKKLKFSNVSFINVPFIKQYSRYKYIKKFINKNLKENDKVLIYSPYLPYLKAIYDTNLNLDVTMIVTDLPEYYDFDNKSRLKSMLRNLQNNKISKYMKKVNKFVLLTEQMKNKLNVDDNSYVVVEGICDTKYHNFHVEKKEKRIVLYTGSLHYQYGIKNLLDAFCIINEKNVELWICGKGEAENFILDLSTQDNRIKYLGFKTHEEVIKLQQQATVLVNPRKSEGEFTKYSFPSKTMEYMLSGTPVIMNKLEGIPLEYYKYLFVPENEDYKSLAETMIHVLNLDRDYLEKFGMNASNFVKNSKNYIIQSEKILELINK